MPTTSSEIPGGYQPLVGSEREPDIGAELVGSAPVDEVLDVTVVLRRRRESQSLPSHWLTPPSRRPRLSAEEFARRYGAAEEDIGAIRAFAHDQSLEVRNVSAARRTVTLSSTVGQFNRAFGVHLNLYQREAAGGRARRQQPAETYRGREGFIYVPEGLVDIIIGVFGLDNLSVTHINAADPLNTDPVPLADITRFYRFPPNQAIGQTIAIFSKGGYLSSDISANFQGNPPLVTDVPVNAVNRKFADPETTQDIVISATVAPGADVAVYFNDGSERGWVETVGRVVHPDMGDPVCSVLSCSFYILNGDDEALTPRGRSAFVTAVSQVFEDAALQGVTVCVASGDNGTQSKMEDGLAHVQYPGSDPWVLSCGGTTIGNIVNTAFDEWVWNDVSAWGVSYATGGGVSAIFPVPWYQVNARIPGSLNDRHRGRGLPDVAANASSNSGYPITVGGSPGIGGGTSASAPLWAGLIARLNAALDENVGFVNPVLYALGSSVFNDIVAHPGAADNGIHGVAGYPARVGWDACTGWGSPNGTALLNGLHSFFGPAIAVNLEDDLDFGEVCGEPTYLEVRVHNVGTRDLMILDVTRTAGSTMFSVAGMPATPLAVAPGAAIEFTVGFSPTAPGPASATLRIVSNDVLTPQVEAVARGKRGSGSVAIAGSTHFGRVAAYSDEQRTLWVANLGTCDLQVFRVSFEHSDPAFELVNNPFPATLPSGASLPVVIEYHAYERYPHTRELVISSDDPVTPLRVVEVTARTV